MTDKEKMNKFAQSVTLAMTGKHMDVEDLESEDGIQWITELVDWTNQFIDELELEADWNYVTELGAVIGTVSSPTQTFPLPAGARKLAVREHRPLHITQDGTPVSTWDVVRPADISSSKYSLPLRERVSYVGRNIVFSRSLNDNEMGGEVLADIVNKIPRLEYTIGQEGGTNDLEVLDLVEPRTLLVLGVAKNATLPNFVRGKLSPSLTQKYSDVLSKAVLENNASASASYYEGEDLSSYGGLY